MKTLLPILFLLVAGCSHFTVEEAERVARARHIEEVYGILGAPEERTWGREVSEIHYIDEGHHVFHTLALIPVVNVATMPIWLVDRLLPSHDRRLAIHYETATGRILDVRPLTKAESDVARE